MMQGDGDEELDKAEFISEKDLNEIIGHQGRHAFLLLYDDLADKDLKERTLNRRVRNDFDKKLWDVLTGEREWAWKVIVISCAMLSNGMGFAIQSFVRTGKGGDGKIERGALWLAMYLQWREAAERKGLSPDMCIDLLWSGLGFEATDRKYKKRRNTARTNLEGCLDLLLDMKHEASREEWYVRWQDKGFDKGIAAGMKPESYEK